MKARTKQQIEVLKLSKQLHDISNKIEMWAKEEHLDHLAYATKNKFICLDCGESSVDSVTHRKQVICTCCGQKLKVKVSNKRTHEQLNYVAYAEVCGEYQVIRNFMIKSYHKAGETVVYKTKEVLQHWVKEDGKREVVALCHYRGWYGESWNGSMEIREKNLRKCWETNSRYEIYPDAYHPDSMFKKCYTRHGINKNLVGLSFLEASVAINNPRLETLLKAKQYAILLHGENKVNRYWHSIKIVMRNKSYRIKTSKDAGLWFDYLTLLEFFGKDLRNAYYVCPRNIQQAHDAYVAKKRKYDKRMSEDNKRKKALRDQQDFLRLKSHFFGLEFIEKEITIKVLESVEEYASEGEELQHCVFASKYFSKPDSLVFSARVHGKRMETVEVALDTLKVVQSRGLYNRDTDYHDQIIRIVERNVNQIKERLNQTAC